jgi:two-component sensor histidine kinase
VTLETFVSALHPDDRANVREKIDAAVAGQVRYDAEFRVVHPDGSTRWIHAKAEMFDATPDRRGRMVGINMDVTQRVLADIRQRVLVQELHHRVKNTLAIVQSIARQTFRAAGEDSESFEAFEKRLANLARTHDLLMRDDMISGTLRAIVGEAIAPYGDAQAGRFRVSGPHVAVEPRAAVAIAMALHELGTNAAKYGALTAPGGAVAITWTKVDPDRLRLTWRETGGPTVHVPARQGFGSRLIERVLAHELGGAARIDYAPEGVVCEIEMVRGAGPV